MDHNTLFAKTPPGKLFVLAALPGAIGMLASALYQLIDGILVGQVLGDTAFAAINLAMPFVIINFALADLIGVGSAVPISVRLGQKEEKAANNIFTCACLMIVGTGALIGAVLFFAAPLLFQLLGAEPELAALAVQYLRVYALLSPLTTIIFASDNYLRICGKIRMSMWLNILMSILTAVLEFFLLAVLKWGIWAAALASSLGMIACVTIALYPFARGKLQLKFCRPRFSVSMVKQIVACGSPNFLNNISGRVTSIIMNAVLLRVGGQNAVSIYGILMYVDGLIQPLMYGCCDSLQPAVSYNWGAGSKGRILAIEKYCFSAAAVISLLSAVVMFLFPDQITALFLSGMDEGFLVTARLAIQLFAFTYVTRWFSFACQSFMTALERAGEASLISISTALIFPVLLLAALSPFGLTGIWLNFAGSSLLAGILAGLLLLRFWKSTGKRPPPHENCPRAAGPGAYCVLWNDQECFQYLSVLKCGDQFDAPVFRHRLKGNIEDTIFPAYIAYDFFSVAVYEVLRDGFPVDQYVGGPHCGFNGDSAVCCCGGLGLLVPSVIRAQPLTDGLQREIPVVITLLNIHLDCKGVQVLIHLCREGL